MASIVTRVDTSANVVTSLLPLPILLMLLLLLLLLLLLI